MDDDDEIHYKLVVSEDGKKFYLKIESSTEMTNTEFLLALECYIKDIAGDIMLSDADKTRH